FGFYGQKTLNSQLQKDINLQKPSLQSRRSVVKNIVHWCKPKKMWTSHTYLSCAKSPVILIIGEWFVETKPNKKSNPRGWIVSQHNQVIVNPSPYILSKYEKTERVFFNKELIQFSHTQGEHLLFDETGCHLIKHIGSETQ